MADATQGRSRVMLFISLLFIFSYFLIHLVINIYFNAPQNSIILTLYGPTSISLCTGLLIYSFGTFLQKTISKISICYPQGYAQQFVIFVLALTVIQFTGHAEIVVNDPTQWASVQTNHPCLAGVISALSILGFPLMVLSLKRLETHQEQISQAMKEHLDIEEDSNSVVKIGGLLTWATLFVTLFVKIITTPELIPLSTESEQSAFKSGAYIIAIAFELLFAGFVFFMHERDKRQ